MVEHRCVKNLIEPGVHGGILKGIHAIDPVEWNSSLKNSVFQLGPVNKFRLDTTYHLLKILVACELVCWSISLINLGLIILY